MGAGGRRSSCVKIFSSVLLCSGGWNVGFMTGNVALEVVNVNIRSLGILQCCRFCANITVSRDYYYYVERMWMICFER